MRRSLLERLTSGEGLGGSSDPRMCSVLRVGPNTGGGVGPPGPPGPPGPSGAGSGIIFRPGGVAAGNVYTTWATAYTALAAANGAATVYVDSSLAPAVVPPGVYPGFGCAILSPFNWTLSPAVDPLDVLTLDDAAVLNRWNGIVGPLQVDCTCATTEAFTFDTGPIGAGDLDIFRLEYGASIVMLAGATVAAIQVPAGGAFFLVSFFGPTLDASATPGVPVIQLQGNGAFPSFLVMMVVSQFNTNGDTVSAAAGNFFQFSHDDTIQAFTSALFLGTLSNNAISTLTNANSSGSALGDVATSDGANGVVWAPPAASSAVLDGVIFQPGGVAGGNIFTTWAAAFAAALATNDTTILYIDTSLGPATVPPGAWNGDGILTLKGYTPGNNVTLEVADGAVLFRISRITGLTVVCDAVTTQPFGFNGDDVLFLDQYTAIAFQVGALVPMMTAPGGGFFLNISALDGTSFDNTNAPTVPCIDVPDNTILAVVQAGHAPTSTFPFLTTGNEIGGTALGTVFYYRDDFAPPLDSVLYAGTTNDLPTDPSLDSDGTVSVPSYSFASDPTSGIYRDAASGEVRVTAAGADVVGFGTFAAPTWRQPYSSAVPLVFFATTDSYFYSVSLMTASGAPAGAVVLVGGKAPTTIGPPLQGAQTGQFGGELAVRGLGQTNLPGTPTTSTPFQLANASFNGKLKVTGNLITPGVGGGAAGDLYASEWFVRASTVGGVTTIVGTTLDGPVDATVSMVGVLVTFAAAGDTVVATVDATAQVSGAGAVTNWQLDLRGVLN